MGGGVQDAGACCEPTEPKEAKAAKRAAKSPARPKAAKRAAKSPARPKAAPRAAKPTAKAAAAARKMALGGGDVVAPVADQMVEHLEDAVTYWNRKSPSRPAKRSNR